MNKALLHSEVQDFILENENTDLSKLILKGSPFPDVSIQEIATQISGLNKAKSKLPTWYSHKEILYPPNLNLEQTSSEVTAEYKAGLVKGASLIDLTGGFGIDSYSFSKRMNKVVHCELNEELSEIAGHNFQILNANNINQVCGDSIEYLHKTEETFDWIFIDPARRDDYGGKIFLLAQCTPDVTIHLDLLFGKASNILIKTAPLLDITSGLRELKNVAEIHVVAVNQDVKEINWVLRKGFDGEVIIKTINFKNNAHQIFESFYPGEEIANYNSPLEYLYEPNPAILKAGLFNEVGIATNTYKLQVNSHLYTSSELIDFPGRAFKILNILSYKKKELRKKLNLKKANITTRNFPKSVEDLRKELKISEGGLDYLFFTTNLNNEKIVIHCAKA